MSSKTSVLVGCSGWCEAKPKYFADFRTVEVQTTFYEPPKLAVASKWRALAPDSFVFCVKAWQLITHPASSPTYRKLKSPLSPGERDLVGFFRPTEQVALAWERTAEICRALNARVILFQCPASFRPSEENVKNLRRFFSEMNREGFELAWEPRGDWPTTLVDAICEDLNLLYCVDPLGPDTTDVRAPYWRLHGIGGYSYRYSDQDLEKLLQMSRKYRPRYIFFNNIPMKEDALRFLELTSTNPPRSLS